MFSAGYTTAHLTQLIKFSENNIRRRKTVSLRQVKHASHSTHLIEFRDGARLVHWKTATFIMIVINKLVDKIMHVARLMQLS